MDDFIVFTDGGSRGNPGPAATGFVISRNNNEVAAVGKCIGITTNNVAEYMAAKFALQHLLDSGLEIKSVTCYLDSLLIVNQLMGSYKIKQPHLQDLAIEVKKIINSLIGRGCQYVIFKHVPREQNKKADSLVNAALDSKTF